jgi:hypothetical protein
MDGCEGNVMLDKECSSGFLKTRMETDVIIAWYRGRRGVVPLILNVGTRWRWHNEELFALYSALNIIRVIKSRRLIWTGHVAGMGERKGA